MLQSEQETEYHGRRHNADQEHDAKQCRRDRPAEVERPARAVAGRHEERWIGWILVQLTESPVLGDKLARRRPPEAAMRTIADRERQQDARARDPGIPVAEAGAAALPHLHERRRGVRLKR